MKLSRNSVRVRGGSHLIKKCLTLPGRFIFRENHFRSKFDIRRKNISGFPKITNFLVSRPSYGVMASQSEAKIVENVKKSSTKMKIMTKNRKNHFFIRSLIFEKGTYLESCDHGESFGALLSV